MAGAARPRRPRPLWLRVLLAPLSLALALWLLLEDWLWQPLLAAMVRLGRWPPVHRLETALGRLRPWPALLVFAVPALVLLPFKFCGLLLLSHGHRLAGLLVFIAAKLVGTALVARIYSLTEHSLVQLPWFARSLAWVRAFKDAMYTRLHAWLPLRQVRLWSRRLMLRLRRRLRGTL